MCIRMRQLVTSLFIVFAMGGLPATLSAQLTENELDALPTVAAPSSGMSPIQRVSIYLLIVVLSFGLFMYAGYRSFLSRDGVWPGTLYGICLGLFLSTCILAIWPLFLGPYQQLEAIRNIGGPVESMGLQAGSIVAAIVAFLLSWRLYRSQPPQTA